MIELLSLLGSLSGLSDMLGKHILGPIPVWPGTDSKNVSLEKRLHIF
jgi:hypothetical protein